MPASDVHRRQPPPSASSSHSASFARAARAAPKPQLGGHGAVFAIASEAVDGMDVVAGEAAARRATHAIRRGEGPRLLEAKTYRFRAHSMFDPDLYRPKEEVEEGKTKGPLIRFSEWILGTGLVHTADIEAAEAAIAAEIETAVDFAEKASWEPVETLMRDVMTPREGAAS